MNTLANIDIEQGILYVTKCGRRYKLATFNGSIEICEECYYIDILGTMCKGMKKIRASFILCDDLKYFIPEDYSTAKIYDITASVFGQDFKFMGLQLTDYNPLNGQVTFEIKDLELINTLLEMAMKHGE